MQLNFSSIGSELRWRNHIISLTCLPNGQFEFVNSLLLLPEGKQHAIENRHTEAPLIKISSQDFLSGLQPLSTKEQAIHCIRASNSTELLSQQSGKPLKKKKPYVIKFSCLPYCMFHFKWDELFLYSWADIQESVIPVMTFYLLISISAINFLSF